MGHTSVENGQIFSSRCFIWMCYQYLDNRSRFCFFELELLRAQPYWFVLYSCRAEEGCFETYLVLLPHTVNLLMTSLIQSAMHKVAALTDMVFATFKFRFVRNWTKYRSAKLLYLFFSNSITIVRASDPSSVRFPFKNFECHCRINILLPLYP